MSICCRNMNICKHWDERDSEQALPCHCAMGKGHLKSHPICTAGSSMCNPISRYSTSPAAVLHKRKPSCNTADRLLWVQLCKGRSWQTQHHSCSERFMVDEYFLPPPCPAPHGLIHILTVKWLLSTHLLCQKISRPQKAPSYGTFHSLQHTAARGLTATFLGQVGTINLSLLLPSPATTYICHLPHWLKHSLQPFCCPEIPSLPLWLPLCCLPCQPFPVPHHVPLPAHEVLPPLPRSSLSWSSNLPQLQINLEGSKHASEGWAVGPQNKLCLPRCYISCHLR